MTKLSDATRNKLKTVSTATVATALFKRGFRNQMIQDVRPLGPDQPALVGEAYTLRYMPAREDLNPIDVFRDRAHPQRKAIEECPPGAVLVIDSRKDARAASAGVDPRRAADAARRRRRRHRRRLSRFAEIARLGIPAYHHRPRAPTNLTLHQAIDINVPIGCGDAPVFPGDVVVGDGEGVDRDPRASRRRDRRRGGRDDGVRGFRHRGGAEGPLDPRALSGDRRADDARFRRVAEGERTVSVTARCRATERDLTMTGSTSMRSSTISSPANGRRWRTRAETSIRPNTNDVVGESARADARASRARDRRGEGGVSGVVAHDAAAAPRHPEEGIGDEILARKDELGRLLVARGRQDAAGGHRRGRARRPDLPVLRRRMRAHRRREDRVGAPRHRHRGHARAARRRRHDHAVEFPDRDSGLEDRAGARLRQLPSCSSRPTSCPARRMRSSKIIARAGVPPGVFNLVMGRGSVVGAGDARASRTSPRSRSPARSRPARRSPPPASRAA